MHVLIGGSEPGHELEVWGFQKRKEGGKEGAQIGRDGVEWVIGNIAAGTFVVRVTHRRPIAPRSARRGYGELGFSVALSCAQPRKSISSSTSKAVEKTATVAEIVAPEKSPLNRNQRSARLTNLLQLRRLYREIIRVSVCVVQSEELMKTGYLKPKATGQMRFVPYHDSSVRIPNLV